MLADLVAEIGEKAYNFDLVTEFIPGQDISYMAAVLNGVAYFFENVEGGTHNDMVEAANNMAEEGFSVGVVKCVSVSEDYIDFISQHSGQYLRCFYEKLPNGVFNFIRTEVA